MHRETVAPKQDAWVVAALTGRKPLVVGAALIARPRQSLDGLHGRRGRRGARYGARCDQKAGPYVDTPLHTGNGMTQASLTTLITGSIIS